MIETIIDATGPFLITFREALEAALVISIMLAYIKKIGRLDLSRYLFIGTGLAIAVSIFLGAFLALIYGGLTGISEKLFEGSASILATVVLTYMIFWMAKNAKQIKGELAEKIDSAVTREYAIGIAILAFIVVVREGIETVLFLTSFAVSSLTATILGLLLGTATVVLLAFMMMKSVYRLDTTKFFKYSSVLLLVFAAGLLGFGVHEFIEVSKELGVNLGVLGVSAFNLNPTDVAHPLHEKGVIGSIFKSLLGYDGNPEWLRVISYLGYWLLLGFYLIRTYTSGRIGQHSGINRILAPIKNNSKLRQ
jgi:high-affinity iron transporter